MTVTPSDRTANLSTETADIAAELRAEMARHRVSQTKLAAVLGISQSQVSLRMLGTVDWRISELIQVAEFLGVPVTRLLPTAGETTHPGGGAGTGPTGPAGTRPGGPPPPPPPPPTDHAASTGAAA